MDWRKYFDETIIKRGEAYYRKAKVLDFSVDGLTRTATVVGSKEYTVKLTFSEAGELTDATCNCPYAKSGEYCKHMAAVLIAEENDSNIMQIIHNNFDGMKNVPLTELYQIMERYNENKTDLEIFKDTINAIISSYKYRGFISYNNAYECALDVATETETAVKSKLSMGDYKSAFDYSMFVIRKFSSTDMDDSDGGICYVCDECLEYIEEAIKDLATAKYAFKKIMSYLKKPNDKEWYAVDQIEYFLLDNFDGPEFYVKKLDYIDKRLEIQLKEKYNYKVDDLLRAKLSILHKLGCYDSEISKIYEKYWKYSAVEEDYIESAIASGNTKEAERILTELIDFHYGLSSEYCRKKLLDMYQNSGEKVKYRAILYDIVAEEYNFGMEKYYELKNLYDDSEWSQIKGGLLEKIRKNNRQFYPDILLDEGLIEELMQFAIGEMGLYFLQKYEKILMKYYPEQVLDKYKKELTEQMKVASTRDMYRDIVRTLRKISKLKGGKPVVKSLAEQWRIDYPRRRAMLEELDKLII